MILLTGGSGLLGRHLAPLLPDCIAPSHEEFDIEQPPPVVGVDAIVHCAAYTDVAAAEKEGQEMCWRLNALGTVNVANLDLPLVYISTEYVFDGARGDYCEEDAPNPVNLYARTKLIGEQACGRAPRHLVIRTLFKPRPFEHPRALTDQWTSGDYVDVIAPLIARAVELFMWERVSGVLHIGTGKKSIFDLAKQSREVEPLERKDVCVTLPRDTSLNCAKWRRVSAS